MVTIRDKLIEARRALAGGDPELATSLITAALKHLREALLADSGDAGGTDHRNRHYRALDEARRCANDARQHLMGGRAGRANASLADALSALPK
jgi:hypothetical protein